MGRRRRIWFPRARALAARLLRPLLVRWPSAGGRRWWERRLVPSLAQVPVGRVARMRNGLELTIFEDPVFAGVWLFGEFEPVETAFVRRFLRPGDAFLDVGANFGWFSLVAARACGPAGRVLAVEPVPENVRRAESNIARNGFADRVVVAATALGNSAGEIAFYTFPEGSLSEATANPRGRADAVAQRVPVDRLDALLARHDGFAPVLWKMDVEGHELAVFEGASGLLGGPGAPVLLFEVCKSYLEASDASAAAIEALLRDAGYDRFWRIDSRRGVSDATTLEWDGPPDHCNFIAAKGVAAAERVAAALG